MRGLLFPQDCSSVPASVNYASRTFFVLHIRANVHVEPLRMPDCFIRAVGNAVRSLGLGVCGIRSCLI